MSRSIRDCFHVRDGLLDPRGSLSSQLPSQAIAFANSARWQKFQNFVGRVQPTKFFQHENFSNESFITQKFPELRYIVATDTAAITQTGVVSFVNDVNLNSLPQSTLIIHSVKCIQLREIYTWW